MTDGFSAHLQLSHRGVSGHGHAVGDGDQLATEIENDMMRRAVDFVEQYALPAARNVLGQASINPARRIGELT